MLDFILSQAVNSLGLGFLYVLIATGLSIIFGMLGGQSCAWRLFRAHAAVGIRLYAVVFAPVLVALVGLFEGQAPAVVQAVMETVKRLRGQVSMSVVEHHAESVLRIADRACVLVNGKQAYEGAAADLAADAAMQARLLGAVHE